MKQKEIKVTFTPAGRHVYVLPQTLLLEAAGRAGIALQTPCGGSGTCGKCRVKVVAGSCPATTTEEKRLGADAVAAGYRLACQAHVHSELTVDVPFDSLLEQEHSILVSSDDADVVPQPTVRKAYFELSQPDREHPDTDWSRLRNAIGDVTVSHSLLCRVPSFLRENGWQGTAVVSNRHLMALEEGDTREHLYGAAFDIGTTTVVGVLVDLANNRDTAVASCMNPQMSFGDDVLSRIAHIREHPHALPELQTAIVNTINSLLQQLARKAAIPIQSVYELVVAGNTTMQQILCGYDPSALGEMPFVPVFDRFRRVHAVDIGVAINHGADVSVFGQIGGFVGGDTLACMVATRIDTENGPALLVDIGTNGEIVLSCGDALYATSTAAGPAFEGARIQQGMRATPGAIEKVLVDQDVACNVIGNVPPIGICGTGLIDAAAQMRKAGIIDMRGKIVAPDDAGMSLPPKLRERIVAHEDGQADFMLATAEESGSDRPVVLTQKDIRELQLALGAIRAGINVLLKRAGLSAGDLTTVFLAGAFGNFIRRSSALHIGLLPPVDPQKIRSVGNAALLGAKLALLSEKERAYAEKLRQKATHIDLSLDPEFQMEFGMAMMFPGDE
ncbi:MAG: DUF4445 domain-containing protein [Chitinivibrionales bacterium]|nr:DUF4445 domain-containing protein [Chitinivibrionales bacterium]MBD3394438.1 DUF4445 domain-containing protein [Chitinivibrionales bacterium]